jgi:NAD-dependent DNA ligase
MTVQLGTIFGIFYKNILTKICIKYLTMDVNKRISELENLIYKWNLAYRSGKTIVDDTTFDMHLEELLNLDPDNRIGNQKGWKSKSNGRQMPLPVHTWSMDKIKTVDYIVKWQKTNGLPDNTKIVLSPKMDGITILNNETPDICEHTAFTGGDGDIGENVSKHWEYIIHHNTNNVMDFLPVDLLYSRGELIITNSDFESMREMHVKKYGNDDDFYATPRDMVSGVINTLDFTDEHINYMSKFRFVRFSIEVGESKNVDKREQLDMLNIINTTKLPYIYIELSDLNDSVLEKHYRELSDMMDMTLDGLIIEIDDSHKRLELGFETNGNPKYAKAYKSKNFVEKCDTKCIGITYQISKNGYMHPVIHVEPVKLHGAVVRKINGDNGRWVSTFGIGAGTKLTVMRSGSIIPRVCAVESVEVPDPILYKKHLDSSKDIHELRHNLGLDASQSWVDKFVYPDNFLRFDESGVNFLADTDSKDVIEQQKIVAFFETLGADGISDGIIERLYNNGFNNIKKLINMNKSEITNIDGFGYKNSNMICDSISKAISNVPLEVLQHASSFFSPTLGSKKLKLLKGFKTKPTLDQILAIDGFSEKTAKVYLNNYEAFFSWLSEHNEITVETETGIIQKGDKCNNMSVVFTKFRDKKLEKYVLENGGIIKSSVSKKVTHLVSGDINKNTGKDDKARSLGIEVLSKDEFESIIGYSASKTEQKSNKSQFEI